MILILPLSDMQTEFLESWRTTGVWGLSGPKSSGGDVYRIFCDIIATLLRGLGVMKSESGI